MDETKKNVRRRLVDIIKSVTTEIERYDREIDELADKFQGEVDSVVDSISGELYHLGFRCSEAIEYLEEARKMLGWKPKDKGE